ncbi:MAG TPA: hypothetical protein VHC45_02835 [Gaiellaceae bacterium]|jgi:hypothetical protein|nr:hypothetical protein [Gaiellaceae bacterium]
MVELRDIGTAGLTQEELEVLTHLDAAYAAFAVLPGTHHPSDHDEVASHVRAIGRIVLGRAAVRARPGLRQFE